MKKILKYLRQNIIGFIVDGIVFGSFGVYAATVIAASSVGYSDNSSLGANNVQSAIDKLNTKATTKIKEAKEECPEGKICKDPICRRAAILHTEICSNTDTTGYCQADGYKLNDVITYGNLGTKGVLTSKDAFDCDVNGDGVYDSNIERFYYVSDMTNGIMQDSNVAVLIYYNNVSEGVASNSTAYAYDSSGENWHGPVTAIKQLPTIFDYTGYAARLLTVQESKIGCKLELSKTPGQLSSKCKYLMENTKYSSSSLKTYGGWLDSPDSLNSKTVWLIYSNYRYVAHHNANVSSKHGVRPAIEVAKSNIDY